MSDHYARLQAAIEAGHARIDWGVDEDDSEGCFDVDLSKGIDADGYTVDGGLCAALVRGIQPGNLQYHYVVIEVRKPCCASCGREADWQAVGSLGFIASGHGDCEQYERDLAERAEVVEAIAALKF